MAARATLGRLATSTLERAQIGNSASRRSGVIPALVRCAHGPLGPRPRRSKPFAPAYLLGLLWTSGVVSGFGRPKEFAMRNISSSRIAAVAAVIASGAAPAGIAGTAPESLEVDSHCVVEVTGVEDGMLITGQEACFTTESNAALHVASLGSEAQRSKRAARSSGTNMIGLHYSSRWYSGSSIRVVGTTCGGGVWYPTGSWNNNIESSRHYCGTRPTSFYDNSNCASLPRRIYGTAASLGSMNNRASCVRYG